MPAQFLHGVEVIQDESGIRPIRTAGASLIGLIGTAPAADTDAFPADTPVLVAGPLAASVLGDTGTLRDAYDAIFAQGVSTAVIVRVEEGADAAATLANVVGEPTTLSGVYAFENAGPLLGRIPRIFAAPGFTSTPAASPANPATLAMITVAEKLRGIVVADGPNTNETDAAADRAKFGSDRLYLVDPHVTVFDTTENDFVTRPASGYVAGLIAKRDANQGFWWSPSNQVVGGVSGTARPISFHLSNPDTEANRLNEGEVATIVQRDGFRLWGNRGTGADMLWAFISVRRTADVIYESIEQAHLWAMDRPMSAQLIEDIRDSVQAFGDGLVAQGALLGFDIWLDPELNTQAALKAGQLFLNFDFEPPAPLERLTFRAKRNGAYYEDLIQSVQSAA